MDVLHGAGWEVVVQNQIDSFEVDSSSQDSSADQHPYIAWAETLHHIVPLAEKPKHRTQVRFWRPTLVTVLGPGQKCGVGVSLYLLLCAISMDDIHIDALVDQLVEEFSRSIDWLYKH